MSDLEIGLQALRKLGLTGFAVIIEDEEDRRRINNLPSISASFEATTNPSTPTPKENDEPN